MSSIVKSNPKVKKHNNLTQAHFFNVSVIAYRLILLAGTDKFLENMLKSGENTYIRITAHDYHNLYGSSSDMSGSYKAIKDAPDDLLNAKLKYKRLKTESDPGRWVGGINWVQDARYNDELKCVEILFSTTVLPLLANVRKSFTYYNLRHIGRLSSMHSIRMYELMMMWRKSGKTPDLTVSYMKNFLGVPDNEYSDPKELKFFTAQVIKKSVKEVTSKTNIEMDFEVVRGEKRATIGYSFSHKLKALPEGEQPEQEELEDDNEGGGDPSKLLPNNDDDPELPF
ncbi:RepB family plasmid replication initiator protein [Acinetobacter baumannii]|uniref:DNA replication protein n=10 Tax=Acinetobacter baumannii TaxID=470 RepID=A0AAP1AG96_ACIBA|nr:RepB family plasmid replication initiator protein [Acinetobacter baumannii]EMT94639.1 DNA replication protein [Acinetobacter baumannii ABNIH5]ETY66905.1 DNA replication protein [Acinetobacter baumannii MDR_MMC4]EXB15623.1 initiator Replication family protein [Acinetobacter baumannii 1397084]EXD24139.1 initiator Replication family protein [Acinetobacter baumannii 34654]EYD11705.1 initiator Replication family protein [Acinetobacter baumannii 44362_2]EYU47098.1 initiator Replication family pr